MSGLTQPSALASFWPREPSSTATGLSNSGPVPLGGGPTSLPTVNNSNLPTYPTSGFGNVPPPVPQQPRTAFPPIQQPVGGTNSLLSNNYATANSAPSVNLIAANLAQNQIQNAQQNQIYQRRLTQLEDENSQRRNATSNITQMGTQILQGQMDVQEQVLQYQFMLEQCMETLDHQNFALNEQAEEVALLRAKMRHFEYLMDAIKHSKEGNMLLRNMPGDSQFIDSNLLCCRDPLTLPAPSTSPFSAGGPTRVTASTFQPFNPRYRSPNSRATAAANLNGRRSVTPSVNNRNLPNTNTSTTTNERPSRRLGNAN